MCSICMYFIFSISTILVSSKVRQKIDRQAARYRKIDKRQTDIQIDRQIDYFILIYLHNSCTTPVGILKIEKNMTNYYNLKRNIKFRFKYVFTIFCSQKYILISNVMSKYVPGKIISYIIYVHIHIIRTCISTKTGMHFYRQINYE